MSTLTPKEKALFEKLFGMSGGYVLNFSDNTFEVFFAEFDVDIHGEKYQSVGTSKAKKLREFWKIEPDELVGPVLDGLIEQAEVIDIQTDWFTPPPDEENKKEERLQLIEDCKHIARRLCSAGPPLNALRQSSSTFNSQYISSQIVRMENSVNADPALAIGTAKELIETCCKTILTDRGRPLPSSPDISDLTKATFKELCLIPEDVPDDKKGSKIVKRLLSNLSTVGIGLAELRNFYGTGHGKDAQSKGLMPRHAKLAVGSASTLVTFLFDTHQETKDV